MSKKPTYDEISQRVRELESNAADLKNIAVYSNESEQIYRYCFENANIGVCLVDPDGNFIVVNNRMVEIFGYSKKELEAMNVGDVSHPEDIVISKEIQKKAKAGEIENSVFQKRYIHKKGHIFWGRVSNSVVRDHAGNPLYFVTHFIDTTEDRKTFEKLQEHQNELESVVNERTKELSESQETLRTVIDNSPFPVAFADINNEKILYWSKSALEKFGHNPKTVSEWYELAYPDPEYRKRVIHRWNQFLEEALKLKKTINAGEYDIVCKDGAVRICEIYAQFIPGHLIVTLNDITEHKKAEKELRINERRYKSAQRMGKVGNWEYDLVNETFWGSDQAKRIYGFDIETDQFTTDEVENCIFERERVHHALIDLIEKDIPYDLEFEIHPVSSPNTKTIRSIAETVRDPSGTPVRVVGVIQDITDQKRSMQEKEKLERQLIQAQKMESIGTLAGGIAHDFNNILASILGFTELALDQVEKNKQIEDDLQEVLTAGNRAKDLVMQILAFARKSEEEIKPLQPSVIIKEVLKFIRSSIPTSIEIRHNIGSDSFIMGNPTQIHQILMNLCTNAAHSMEANGGLLELSTKDISFKSGLKNEKIDLKPGDYIQIRVSDTGTGIHTQIINSIFDPYFTTKGLGQGTGMGLSVVHGIVETYDGKITVASRPGKGSTFTIYLPITKKRQLDRIYKPEDLPTGSEKILYVDDEAPIAKIGSRTLEQLGYSVVTRTSSIEALELFKSKSDAFNLVITDMTMPNMTGDVLASKLMSIRPDIPVILCTGFSKKISDESAAEIGIKAFVNKPFVKADLAKTVRKVLDETIG